MREGKFLEKFRLAASPYFCPMCGCVNENLFHFVSDCKELSELRKECFGRKFGSDCWLTERMAERNTWAIKQLCKFLRLGIQHRKSCLVDSWLGVLLLYSCILIRSFVVLFYFFIYII